MEKLRIGITVGDINGIGLEVILKTLSDDRIKDICIPVIYGSAKVVAYHKNIVGIENFHFQPQQNAERLHKDKVNVVNCWQENVNITLGRISEVGGKYAHISLDAAVSDLKNGLIDALVTAPINKKAMQMVNFPHPGHTEFLTTQLGGAESLMLLVNDTLRMGVATNHLPLRDVAAAITKKQVITKLKIMEETLRIDFGIDRPNIAVLALNPHASDDGVIGDEEEKVIRPAVVECKKNKMMVLGPFSADGFFGSGQYTKFDGILAMYHDQGLIPFKALSFGHGVNYTAGLPLIRTSPDHGTAHDLAGKNAADPSSFRSALFLAMDIARNRKEYFEMRENALKKHRTVREVEEGDAPTYENM